jgi:propanol-preferring alcohol dehydrogenase
MKAMVAGVPGPEGRRPLVMRELPLPEPGPGAIRIRVEACGVCRTDLHILEGDLGPGRADLVPGHQIVGTVEAIGAGAEGFRIGERAGVSWLYWTCGVCGYCTTGRENLCEKARFTGWDADGGYAEAMIVPASHAFPVPEAMDAIAAAPLLCAGVIGYRSLKLSGIRPGEALGLFGFGASAHLAIQTALRWGCRVHVFTRDEDHRRHALALGARWAGPLEETPPEALHAAVTFAPSGAVAAQALSRLRRGGTVAINAVHMDDLPPIPFAHLYHERSIRTVANLTRSDVREFLEMAVREPFQVSVNPFPLEKAGQALERLKASAFLGAAVLEIGTGGTAGGTVGGAGVSGLRQEP